MVVAPERSCSVDRVSHKQCRKCLDTKTAVEFYANSQKSDGLATYCKACISGYEKERYQRDHDKIRARTRAWYDANPDKVRSAWRERYSLTRAGRIKYVSEWQKNNKALRSEYQRRYAMKNAQAVALKDRRRKEALKRATVSWSELAAINDLYCKARELTALTRIEWQVDHIVPIKSNLVCGLHVLDNLQIVTKAANSSKGNRHWPDMCPVN